MPQKLTLVIICSSWTLKFNCYCFSVCSLQELDQLVQHYQQSAFADGTKHNLWSQFRAYQDFCSRYDLTGLPASGETLSRFAVWLAVTKRAKTGQTIKNFLSAVRTLHKLSGKKCDTPSSNGQLQLTVKGLSKKLAKPKRRMFPITKDILKFLIKPLSPVLNMAQTNITMTHKQILNIFGPAIEYHVYKALYLVLFLSFLRISSLIPASVSKFDKLRQLTWGDVKVENEGIILKITLIKI